MEPPEFQPRQRATNSNSNNNNAQHQPQFYPSEPQHNQFVPNHGGGGAAQPSFYNPGQPSQQPTSAPTGQPGFMPDMGQSGNMMAGMAMNYIGGQNFEKKGEEMLEKYIDSKSLKLYFQVDTTYVTRKIKILFLPFLHKEWIARNPGTSSVPLTPRDDVNIPDLYIPFMALLTYVLLAGIKLGASDHQFTPESLGTSLSSGMGWLIFELLVVLFVIYLISVRTDMKTYDILSYLGYKFVPVCAIMTSTLFISGIYWPMFLGTSASCAFFIAKTMETKIKSKTQGVADENYGSADMHAQQQSKTRYVTWAIAGVQPLLIWILTYSFA